MADSSPAQEEQGKTVKQEGPGKTVKPFASVLQEMDNGQVHARVSSLLTELTDLVNATGRAGALVLTLKLAPASKGAKDSGALLVSATVTAKKPAEEERKSIFFVNQGALTRENPAQPALPMRIVPSGASDLPIREREAR